MTVIGLCGSSGSGKGYVCQLFTQRGFIWIDTDRVYRDIISSPNSPCVKELAKCFGNSILNEDGSLNKRELSKIVFCSDDAESSRKKLNGIAHRHILLETERMMAESKKAGASAVIIDAPVLFESGFDKMCDVKICVTAPYDKKLQRIITRDGITEAEARARLDCQLSDDELRERCDYEIDNSGKEDVDFQIDGIISALKL